MLLKLSWYNTIDFPNPVVEEEIISSYPKSWADLAILLGITTVSETCPLPDISWAFFIFNFLILSGFVRSKTLLRDICSSASLYSFAGILPLF